MSEEQLAALLAKLKDDAGLQEKLKGAADLDAILAIAKDAGFDISKADLLRHGKALGGQALELSDEALELSDEALELSDEELEGVAGGYGWSIGIVCKNGY